MVSAWIGCAFRNPPLLFTKLGVPSFTKLGVPSGTLLFSTKRTFHSLPSSPTAYSSSHIITNSLTVPRFIFPTFTSLVQGAPLPVPQKQLPESNPPLVQESRILVYCPMYLPKRMGITLCTQMLHTHVC